MPEIFKALVVVLGLSALVFACARAPACAVAVAPQDFARRRNLWFAVTLAAFLAHNYWLYVLIAAMVLLMAQAREPNKLALYFVLLFAVPPFAAQIPGFGVVDHLFALTHLRLLALVVLLPAFLALLKQPDKMRLGSTLPDKLVLCYLALNFVLQLKGDTLTNTLRHGALYAFTDVFLPYYVASRGVRSVPALRDALMSFTVAALVLAAIGAFEFVKYWMLYVPLESALDVRWGYGNYTPRGSNLRAQVSTGHPIALGYAIAVGFAFLLCLKKSVPGRATWWLALLLLCAGMVAPLSRGPWVGAAAITLLFVATGPAPMLGLARLAVAGAFAMPLLLLSPAGGAIIDHLPFVGTVEAGNVTYRQRLLEVSIQVILENPFFGGVDVNRVEAMQELRADGIIDVVNTYIGVALAHGLIGLSLFAGFFVAVAGTLLASVRTAGDRGEETCMLGRGLLCALAGILVIIFTVASITVIPAVYWAVAGLGVAYARLAPAQSRQAVPVARYRASRSWG
jgi:O-antigen ligase